MTGCSICRSEPKTVKREIETVSGKRFEEWMLCCPNCTDRHTIWCSLQSEAVRRWDAMNN